MPRHIPDAIPGPDADWHDRLWLADAQRYDEAALDRERLAARGIRPGPPKTWGDGHGTTADFGLNEPLLVLATPTGGSRHLTFGGGRDWLALYHQTGGHQCLTRLLTATVLRPTSAMWQVLVDGSARFEWTQTSRGHADLEDLLWWDSQLQQVGARCRFSHRRLEEGLLPIDLGGDRQQVEQTLRAVCEDADSLLAGQEPVDERGKDARGRFPGALGHLAVPTFTGRKRHWLDAVDDVPDLRLYAVTANCD